MGEAYNICAKASFAYLKMVKTDFTSFEATTNAVPPLAGQIGNI